MCHLLGTIMAVGHYAGKRLARLPAGKATRRLAAGGGAGGSLGLGLKLHLFRAAVLSVLAHGSEAWWLSEKAVVKLRSWAARCLARVTGRDVREEWLAPTRL